MSALTHCHRRKTRIVKLCSSNDRGGRDDRGIWRCQRIPGNGRGPAQQAAILAVVIVPGVALPRGGRCAPARRHRPGGEIRFPADVVMAMRLRQAKLSAERDQRQPYQSDAHSRYFHFRLKLLPRVGVSCSYGPFVTAAAADGPISSKPEPEQSRHSMTYPRRGF